MESLNKVVVVDDDPAILRMLDVLLQRTGYDVVAIDSGEEALNAIVKEAPSFVITDWEMPGMDGLELCRRIRQMDLLHYVYIVFLTSRFGETDLRAAMEVGADDFLSKPLRQDELSARLTAGSRVLRLESHLSKLAAEDTLTGLLLRRAFSGFVSKEWRRAQRHRLPLSMAMLDIDHFKRINDEYGHPAGDEVIRAIAGIIQSNIRESDVVCRYGGEEFCVMLPETDEEGARTWAERLRARVAEAAISIGSLTLHATISVGVSEMVADMEESEELLHLSDECLLAAKQCGRDRVISSKELARFESTHADRSASNAYAHVARNAMIPLMHTLHPEWPIVRGASYLLQHGISSAPVTDEDGKMVGIVSIKDVLEDGGSCCRVGTKIGELMRQNVVSFEQDVKLSIIVKFMLRASIRSVVITSLGRPCGLISRSALVRWILSNAENDASAHRDADEFESVDTNWAGKKSPELELATVLCLEADKLRLYLQCGSVEDEPHPAVGVALRLQKLINEILTTTTASRPARLGLPA